MHCSDFTLSLSLCMHLSFQLLSGQCCVAWLLFFSTSRGHHQPQSHLPPQASERSCQHLTASWRYVGPQDVEQLEVGAAAGEESPEGKLCAPSSLSKTQQKDQLGIQRSATSRQQARHLDSWHCVCMCLYSPLFSHCI